MVNCTRDSVLASRARVADRWWSRARGFLGRPPPRTGEAILLSPCRAVHMLGMRYALDVVFLDRGFRVVALHPRLEPGQRSPWHRHAHCALEVPPGTIDATHTALGDLIAWRPADANDPAPLPDPRRRNDRR